MNKRGKIFFIIISSIFLIMTCILFLSFGKMSEKIMNSVPKEAIELSQKSLDLLKNKEFEELSLLLRNTKKRKTNINQRLNKVYDYIEPCGDIKDKEKVAVNISSTTVLGGANINVVLIKYQVECENKYFLYQVKLDSQNGGKYKILDIHTMILNESLEETHKLNLTNKDVSSYLFIFTGILSLLISFYTASIAFSRKEKKYIFWTIVSLVGGWNFLLNWSTGDMGMQMLSVGLPNFSVRYAGKYSPIIFGFRIPLGACFYWINRLKSKDEETNMLNEFEETNNY